jgi:hypothetical protein
LLIGKAQQDDARVRARGMCADVAESEVKGDEKSPLAAAGVQKGLVRRARKPSSVTPSAS